MNLLSHRWLEAAPRSMALCLVLVLLTSACANSPAAIDSVPAAQCELLPVIPSFTVTGAEVPETGELTIEGEISALSIVGDVVEVSVGDGAQAAGFTIENSGVDEIDLVSGQSVAIDYWYRQGFEGVAQGLRIRDGSGVALIVEDGDYGSAVGPEDLEPFSVAQTDIGCRNRANHPGSLNNFGLMIEGADAAAELMPGARSILTVDGNDYAVRSLRSTSRHSDAEWTDAPYTHTSFSIARQ